MIHIGFTFDLRDHYLAQGYTLEQVAEFDTPETITLIENALIENGYNVSRIGNLKQLVASLAKGQTWDIVFNICEGVEGLGREAQVPSLLEAYNIPFVFSSSSTAMITLNKALAKTIARSHGVPTADFTIVQDMLDLENISMPYPLFVKPLAEGTGKGIDGRSVIKTPQALQQACAKLLQDYPQGLLVETFLPGRDLTVGLLGHGDQSRVIGVLETTYKKGAQNGGQSFFNKENCEEVLEYQLITDETAKKASELAIQSWKALDCVDAGRVDFRCDVQGNPHFLEVNPLAGLHPHHSDLPILAEKAGITYLALMREIMENALTRNNISFHQKKSPTPQEALENSHRI